MGMYLFSVSGFNIRREIQSTEEQLINHLERIAFASMMSQKLIDHCQETGKRNQEPGNKGTQREGMGRKKKSNKCSASGGSKAADSLSNRFAHLKSTFLFKTQTKLNKTKIHNKKKMDPPQFSLQKKKKKKKKKPPPNLLKKKKKKKKKKS